MLTSWFSLLAFLIAALAVLWSIPFVKATALRYGQVEPPGTRKVHQRPMVRLGGISICTGTLLALLLVNQAGGFTHMPAETMSHIRAVLFGSFGFFLIGLTDDLFGLSPIVRLFIQCGIAALVWLSGVHIEFLTMPGVGIVQLEWLSLPLTVFWIVGVVNAINWIDGLDGLASGVSGIAAIAIFIICLFTGQFAAALVAAALAGSLLSFLHYNFNPAQIFMGDGGSYFIGSAIAGVSIVGLVKGATIATILLPPLILAVPILDMSAVIVSRLSNGRSPFIADQRHLHHRLLKAGLSHRSTVLVIYVLTLWAGSLSVVLVGIPNGLFLLGSTTGLLGCTTWRVWRIVRQH